MFDKDLINLLGNNKKRIFIITLTNIVNMFANIGGTAIICKFFDMLITTTYAIQNVVVYMIIALLLVLLKSIVIILLGQQKEMLGQNVKLDLRQKTYEKLFRMGLDNSSEKVSSFNQMAIEGIEQLDLYYTNYLPQFFSALISPIILFVICVVLEWKTAFVLLACLPLIPISIIAVSKYAKKIFSKYWEKYNSMGDKFFDNLQGMKDLKIFDADEKKQIQAKENAEEFRKITMKVLVMQLASITIMDIVAFGGAAVAIVMTLLSGKNGEISPIIALFLILITVEFFLPMRALGSSFHIAMNGATAGKNIISFLNSEEKKLGNEKIVSIDNIKLQEVYFGYDTNKEILKNLSMNFKIGLNSIVGESGCGKSTVVALLLGNYNLNFGNILINEKKLADCDLKEYYKKLAMVGSNTFLFNDTIRNNFKMAKKHVSDIEIFNALKKVDMYDYVKNVGGLDFIILENSENISGGQRQRIALAISLISEKELYIFDEATSNIDIESEKIIINNIKDLAKTKIVVLISHRLANVVDSNKIYFIKDGAVFESGNHNQLISQNGEYKKIFNYQYNLENGYKGETNA